MSIFSAKKLGFILVISAVFIALTLQPVLAKAGILIVNSEISKDFTNFSSGGALKDLFLGKRTTFQGKKFVPARAKEGGYLLFLKNILEMTPGEEETYWLKESFRGEVEVWDQLEDDEEVIEHVASNDGPYGLGIVSKKSYKKATDKDIRPLQIDGKKFTDKKYPLQ